MDGELVTTRKDKRKFNKIAGDRLHRRIIDLAAMDIPVDLIAEKLEVSRISVQQHIRQELEIVRANCNPKATLARINESLAKLRRAFWPRALHGDVKAGYLILKCLELDGKLNGALDNSTESPSSGAGISAKTVLPDPLTDQSVMIAIQIASRRAPDSQDAAIDVTPNPDQSGHNGQ